MAISFFKFVEYSGPAADCVLLFVLGVRGRWKIFPAFTLLAMFDLVATLLNLAFDFGSTRASYATIDAASVLLQLAVIIELLRNVIPSSDRLAERGRKLFAYCSSVGLLLAGGVACFLNPPRLQGPSLYEAKLDVFTGLLVCEAVIAMMLAAQQVGLGWRNHVLAIGQGLMIWAFSYVLVEGFGPYLNFHHDIYDKLYYARSIIYLGTLCYWSVSLWRKEPPRKPIPASTRKYIVALHEQVQYDLGKVGH